MGSLRRACARALDFRVETRTQRHTGISCRKEKRRHRRHPFLSRIGSEFWTPRMASVRSFSPRRSHIIRIAAADNSARLCTEDHTQPSHDNLKLHASPVHTRRRKLVRPNDDSCPLPLLYSHCVYTTLQACHYCSTWSSISRQFRSC